MSNITDIYSIKRHLIGCFPSEDYEPSKEFIESISLTPLGKEKKEILLSELKLKEDTALFSILMIMGDKELFIDESTNIGTIESDVSFNIISSKLKYGFQYGTELYDFVNNNDLISNDIISRKNTDNVLSETETGVFQVGQYVIGPLGLLSSKQNRYVPPTRVFPLRYCEDPACETLHGIRLKHNKNRYFDATKDAFKLLRNEGDDELKWELEARKSCMGYSYYESMSYANLPQHIGSAYSNPELANLATLLLEDYSKELRAKIDTSPLSKKKWDGTAEKIISSLSHSEILQIILLLGDEEIVASLEKLIHGGVIEIPSSETRRTRNIRILSNWDSTIIQSSQYGLRAVPKGNSPTAMLTLLVNNIHADESARNQLKWKLRYSAGDTLDQKLDDYIQNNDPEHTIKELIITDQSYLQRLTKLIRHMYVPNISDQLDEEAFIRKLMWKIGYRVQTPGLNFSHFFNYINSTREAATQEGLHGYQNHDLARSSASNLFVSMEDFLDKTISFITWALLGDHYAKTRFVYRLPLAREFMANIINNCDHNDAIEIDKNGKNTLYPLIHSFRVLARECTKTLDNSTEHKRPKEEFPGFHNRSTVGKFPFPSTKLLCDIETAQAENLIHTIEEVTVKLDDAQICDIRNRIQHKRENFPSTEEIIAACDLLFELCSELENAGVAPVSYTPVEVVSDKYGRQKISFSNYKKSKITYPLKLEHRMNHAPLLGVTSLVFIPIISTSITNEPIRFHYVEESEYVSIWNDHP